MLRKRWPLLLFMAVFIGMIALSAWKLIDTGHAYRKGKDTYANITQAAVIREKGAVPAEQVELMPTLDEEKMELNALAEQKIEVDFSVLRAINNDAQGWLLSADGTINYPVVQGTDNEYYLHHLMDGTENDSGSLFMDFRNAAEMTDRNTFIYGHNMRNGSMFGQLEEMDAAELELFTPTGRYLLRGFAGYVTPGNSDIYQISYADDEEFAQYLERIQLMSEFDAGVEVTAQDRIVTLSTCAYDYDDARYVLHCKIEKLEVGGETDEEKS